MRSDRIYRIFRIIFSVFFQGRSCGRNAGRNLVAEQGSLSAAGDGALPVSSGNRQTNPADPVDPV